MLLALRTRYVFSSREKIKRKRYSTCGSLPSFLSVQLVPVRHEPRVSTEDEQLSSRRIMHVNGILCRQRERRGGAGDDGEARGRAVRAERHEGVGHERQRGRELSHLGQRRPRRQTQGAPAAAHPLTPISALPPHPSPEARVSTYAHPACLPYRSTRSLSTLDTLINSASWPIGQRFSTCCTLHCRTRGNRSLLYPLSKVRQRLIRTRHLHDSHLSRSVE